MSAGENFQEFSSGAVIWRQLSHPNVLPFCGVRQMEGENPPRVCLASPWMENGNLIRFFTNYPDTYGVPLVSRMMNFPQADTIVIAFQ